MRKILFVLTIICCVFVMPSPFLASANSDDTPDGFVTVPVLLYHHISNEKRVDRYYVSPKDFRAQMEILRTLGYKTITIKRLVDILARGGYLPQRPVIITFDDGNLDVYENAYPIMKALNFTGTVYIVSNRLKSEGFLQKKELSELVDDGWEVGSHSMTHTNLTLNHALVRSEVLQSRLDLEKALGVKVESFAYPFGVADPYVMKKVSEYGYRSGVGVGITSFHTLGTSFYLSRREVIGSDGEAEFMSLLPWTTQLPPNFYPHYDPW